MSEKKTIVLLGAAGSIGNSTLDIVRSLPDRFRVRGLATHRNVSKLASLSAEFKPEAVVVSDEATFKSAKAELFGTGVKVFSGDEGLCRLAAWEGTERVVNAIVGAAGIRPTFAAVEAGNSVAIANKETLVAAGPLILNLAREKHVPILPIDSEHSAIFQCLQGESPETIRTIWLTTSGGSVFDTPLDDLDKVTPAIALAHPTWRMGPKITIDSATLMNKGLEVIEAQRLFSVSPSQIKVVVHQQSIVHSAVEFCDGSFKAQLSTPDMRLPILYALSYPERIESTLVPTCLTDIGTLTFEDVPTRKFPALKLAYRALEKGGTAPAALSAADEVVVQGFLEKKITFMLISRILTGVLDAWPDEPLQSLDGVLEADQRARQMAEEALKHTGSVVVG